MSELPEILTKSTVLPSLASLDAGDVVECYTLIRMAKLENVPFSTASHNKGTNNIGDNTNGSNNSTSTSGGPHAPTHIEIRKSAVAFRYKPKPTSKDIAIKDPFELTLEYGPQRTGATQSLEAMPFVNGESFLDNGDQYEDQKYVSWENHAKIYYTLSIDEEKWTNAYYMAPITGAVLSKIMDYITDYPTQHPRYQPFSVVAKESGKTVLKSSNSDDFVWNVFGKLADLYVQIKPVLAPKRYGLLMYVDTPRRDVKRYSAQQEINRENKELIDGNHDGIGGSKNGNPKYYVANAAAEFYEALYGCIGSIKSGDYSAYVKTLSPTPSPTSLLTSTPTAKPTSSTIHSPVSKATHTSSPYSKNKSFNHKDGYTFNLHNGTNTSKDNNDNGMGDDQTGNRHRQLQDDSSLTNTNNDIVNSESNDEGINDQDSNDDDDLDPNTISEETFDSSLGKADDAKEAAEESEKAAEEAKEAAENVLDDAAVVAAEHAVEAAKKAAQATSDAAALTAIEGLLSGDGMIMTSILSTCFSDRKYEITKEKELILGGDQSVIIPTTYVYLYVDGASYYRVNITSPYLKAVELEQPQWKPRSHDGAGRGDFIDFALASTITILFLFGIVVMLHQVGLINWGRTFQFRRFFHPSSAHSRPKNDNGYKATPVNDEDDEERNTSNSDMNSRRMSTKSRGLTGQSSNSRSYTSQRSTNDQLGGIEMTNRGGDLLIDTSFHENPQSVENDLGDQDQIPHGEKLDFVSEKRPERMIAMMKETIDDEEEVVKHITASPRNPDMVQFPDLKSYSKIAQPVGVSSS